VAVLKMPLLYPTLTLQVLPTPDTIMMFTGQEAQVLIKVIFKRAVRIGQQLLPVHIQTLETEPLASACQTVQKVQVAPTLTCLRTMRWRSL